MALKWWPQANWTRTIAELFSELRGELTSLQPMDSKDIRWNKTANGMEALLVELPRGAQAPAEEAEAAPARQGAAGFWFQVTLTQVDDTEDWELYIAPGECYIGNQLYSTPETTFATSDETLAESGILRLYIHMTDEDSAPSWVLAAEDDPPPFQSGVLDFLVARINMDAKTIANYIRERPYLFILGECA